MDLDEQTRNHTKEWPVCGAQTVRFLVDQEISEEEETKESNGDFKQAYQSH